MQGASSLLGDLPRVSVCGLSVFLGTSYAMCWLQIWYGAWTRGVVEPFLIYFLFSMAPFRAKGVCFCRCREMVCVGIRGLICLESAALLYAEPLQSISCLGHGTIEWLAHLHALSSYGLRLGCVSPYIFGVASLPQPWANGV